MSKVNPNRDAIGLIIFLIVFGIFLIFSIIAFITSTPIFVLGGIPANIINGLVVLLSIIGLIRTLWHIVHF